MINVEYKDKIFCSNKLNYDYDRLYSYNFSYRREVVWRI